MVERHEEDSIRFSVAVDVSPDAALRTFVEELASWWPPEYTWAQNALEAIRIEPKEGGRCFERGPHGFECDWGRVVEYDPPKYILFLWQISPTRAPEPDPGKASKVEVRFEPVGQSATRVMLEHRAFANHGDGSEDYKATMSSPQGWPYILDRYRAAAG